MLKFGKTFVILILLLFILSPLALATFDPGQVRVVSTPETTTTTTTAPLVDTSSRVAALVQVIGTLIAMISFPICIVAAILILVKGTSKKKIPIAILLIIFPIILFFLSNIIFFFMQVR